MIASVLVRDSDSWGVTTLDCILGTHDFRGGFEVGKDRLLLPDFCDKPNFLKCSRCSLRKPIKCGAQFKESCKPCSYGNQGRVKQILTTGLQKGSGWLECTMTAPGQDQIPWDKSKCSHSSGIACSSNLGCISELWSLAEFNSDMPIWFNRLIQDFRRKFPNREIQYAKVAETQKRGAIHYHILFTGLEGLPLKKVAKVLRYLMKKHGFGRKNVVKFADSFKDVSRAVNYCAKYLTKGSQRAVTVGRSKEAASEDFIRLGGYRRFTQSRDFGPTMKEIKEQYRQKHVAQNLEESLRRNPQEREARADPPLDFLNMSYTMFDRIDFYSHIQPAKHF